MKQLGTTGRKSSKCLRSHRARTLGPPRPSLPPTSPPPLLPALPLSVVATLLGTALGITYAWVAVQGLVRVVVPETPMDLPWGQLALAVLVSGAAGLVAAVLVHPPGGSDGAGAGSHRRVRRTHLQGHAMDTRDAAADRKKTDGRGPFEKFVEAVNGQVSRAPFFLLILAIIVAWLVSYPLWSSS